MAKYLGDIETEQRGKISCRSMIGTIINLESKAAAGGWVKLVDVRQALATYSEGTIFVSIRDCENEGLLASRDLDHEEGMVKVMPAGIALLREPVSAGAPSPEPKEDIGMDEGQLTDLIRKIIREELEKAGGACQPCTTNGKKTKKPKDPNAPKKPLTEYQQFVKDCMASNKGTGTAPERMAACSAKWREAHPKKG